MGNPEFAPIAAHNGQELSFKDDLEGIGYVLLHIFLDAHKDS